MTGHYHQLESTLLPNGVRVLQLPAVSGLQRHDHEGGWPLDVGLCALAISPDGLVRRSVTVSVEGLVRTRDAEAA